MAIAFVQGRSVQQAGASSVSLAFSSNVTAGSLVIASSKSWLNPETAATCADNLGNAYARDQANAAAQAPGTGGSVGALFSSPGVTGGALTVTVTDNATTNLAGLMIAEFSGALTSGVFDVGVPAVGTNSPFATGSTATTAQAAAVAIWAAGHDGSPGVTPTSGNGYTLPAALRVTTGSDPFAMGYKVLSATGAQSDSITWTAASTGWHTVLGVYKADTTPPVIAGVVAVTPGDTFTTVSWTTDEAASSQAEYGTTTGYGASTPLDSALVRNHSAYLAGLTPSTLYHYRVKSADAAGNLATGTDNTVTTGATPTAPPTASRPHAAAPLVARKR